MSIADEKYVAVTTTKRSGDTVSTPVWIVETTDGRIGFITEADSGKVKRIGNFPDVTVQPCDSRGRVKEGSESVDAVATVVRGADVEPFAAALRGKYGLWVPVINLGYKVRNLVKRRPATVEVAVVLELR
ncbi:MAG TPA: PPOX class F420-dependent oxidoreductase [Ilumatobacteraceae bacterium]|nr:PPOX class F420-dependent oxidoreductase [Ilumatobacteraceae bacterium]